MTQPLINISRKHALIFAGFLVLYEFLTYIANDMIMPGMIKVVESFHGPESAVASSLTAYMLGGASLQLFLGPLSDCYGRRPVMITGALLFFLCTMLIACSNSIDQFLIDRFFQGMGLCFICVIGYATLQEIFDEMNAIRLIALMANVSTLAPLIGPLLGAVFIHYFSWRIIFVMIGALSLIALWGLWRFMPEPIGQTRRDGEQIKPTSLSLRVIMLNYKQLLFNPQVLFGSIALGLLSLPCVVWIALSPIILVHGAKLSLLQYGLWQLPVFGATIVGSWFLQRITYLGSLKKITFIGSAIVSTSLLVTFVLPISLTRYFMGLMPGLIVYFFGLGITAAPLNRFILFSTSVSKGTTSALISMVGMCVQAIGIEAANFLYATHNNILLGFYCALIGIMYLISLYSTFSYSNKYTLQQKESGPTIPLAHSSLE